MQCPKDSSELQKRIFEADIEIDECPKCKGMWLDHGELEQIQETLEHDYTNELSKMPEYINDTVELAKNRSETTLSCPACGGTMEKREYGYCSLVVIDSCPSCQGIWLDKGELKKLEIFFERCRHDASHARTGFLASLFGMFHG